MGQGFDAISTRRFDTSDWEQRRAIQAQRRISGICTTEDLGPANPAAAVQWYRKAAEKGEPLAQNNLADMYLRGIGVTQDDAAAFYWFQKAATQGQAAASIKLAYVCASGRGTGKNLEEGYRWVLVGTLAGDGRGTSLLKALKSQLSQEQRARAEKRAAEAAHGSVERLSATLQR
jgi:TPR repeat protein